jgi:hypothetical protein
LLSIEAPRTRALTFETDISRLNSLDHWPLKSATEFAMGGSNSQCHISIIQILNGERHFHKINNRHRFNSAIKGGSCHLATQRSGKSARNAGARNWESSSAVAAIAGTLRRSRPLSLMD